MKIALRCLVPALAVLLFAVPAAAQNTTPRNLPIPGAAQEPQARFGVDGGFFLPLGDLSDVTGPALGALGRLEYPVALNATMTLRVGYLHGLSQSNGGLRSSVSYLPILGGFKFFPGQRPLQHGGLYLAGELGPNLVIARVRLDAPAASDSDREFRFALGAGAGFEAGPLDLRGGLFVADVGNFGDALGLLFSVGVTF